MSKKTGYLLGILLTISLCMILAWIFCCGPNAQGAATDSDRNANTDSQNAVTIPEASTSMGLNLRGPDGKFAFNSNDNFNFNSSNFAILNPISGQVNEGIGKLKAYLDAQGNENKMIDITGYYDSDEENTSAFANLGLARSTAVKNYFVYQGIASNRINTYGELRASMVPDGTIYRGPVAYKLITQAAADEEASKAEMSQVADAIKAEPLVMYFDYAETSVTLSEKQRLLIGDISRYLDKVNGATITVEGHTDNQGSDTTNNRLGLERADFAKEYLKNNGISDAKVKTVSKGKRNPIASNDTEEGRAKNRRAIVTIN